MFFQWRVNDGYAGGSRTQYTEVDDTELLACEDVGEASRLVEDAIRNDYLNIVRPEWNADNISAKIEALFTEKKLS